MDENALLDGDDEEEEEKVDPKTLAPDLYHAAKNRDIDEVTRLLQEEVPPSYIDKELGYTPLHWAALHGDYRMTQTLLFAGASGPYHRQLIRENKIDLGSYLDGAPNATATLANTNTTSTTDKENKDDNTTNPINTEVDEDDENTPQDDDDKTFDYTKNTPLLWAVFKGHLDIIWLLLLDGYSPNDLDDLQNNALHLAASSGHKKVVHILIDDGGMATAVNHYQNTPVEVAQTKEIRDMLRRAQKSTASITEKEIYNKHIANVKKFKSNVESVQTTIQQYSKLDIRPGLNLRSASAALSSAADIAREEGLDEEYITRANKLIKKYDLIQDFYDDLEKVNIALPIIAQSDFIEWCHPLQNTMNKCIAEGIDQSVLTAGDEVIKMCTTSCQVAWQAKRLTGLECAQPENHHDMIRLKESIDLAEKRGVSQESLKDATALYSKLDAEEKMAIALAAVPEVVRLPKEEPPEDYWQECDTGEVIKTEGYPLPPTIDGVVGDYEWQPSETYSKVAKAIELLKESTTSAGDYGANEEVLEKALISLKKCEKDMKQLEIKNEEDKVAGIEQAQKEAKKLKKGKKKKG